MREEMMATATPTIAEKLGIEYKEKDGLFYPFWNMSDTDDFATLGKYEHRWMRMLMEHHRYLYNQYFMNGTLVEKAKEKEEMCWQLHDAMVEKMKTSKGVSDEKMSSSEKFQMMMQIEGAVDEIVTAYIREELMECN